VIDIDLVSREVIDPLADNRGITAIEVVVLQVDPDPVIVTEIRTGERV
jgi:hypothetical protein